MWKIGFSFLQNCKQRVKLSQECFTMGYGFSRRASRNQIGALTLYHHDNLDVTGSDPQKYVDDTTISESIPKHESSKIQTSVVEPTKNSTADKFRLNQAKFQELRITFAKTVRCFAPVYVNGLPIEVVPSGILGLRISKDLKWDAHISDIAKKVSTRL